jgi:hypothetical protein
MTVKIPRASTSVRDISSARRTLPILSVLTLSFVLMFPVVHSHAEGSLTITEIMGSNSSIFDEDGDRPDWIEIYNAAPEVIDLNGYGLSDKSDNLDRWVFPGKKIEPGEYLVVFASGKDKRDKNGTFHTNFKISEKDRGIYLSDNRGLLLDNIAIDELPRDISYGRSPRTGELVYFSSATPGKANNLPAFSPAVRYSVKGGFYPSPVSVELYTEKGDPEIYYTVDGSTPTVASKVYSGPINVDSNVTIRAISLRKGHLIGPPTGQTYFIDFDNKGMAVLAISVENDKLWDPVHGILRDVSYSELIERNVIRAHASYFDENGEMGISQDAFIGVVGASSREIMMRPLKVSANQEADPMNRDFKYDIFGKGLEKYRHFQVRNNNQDGVRYLSDPESRPTMGIRNALFSEIVHGREGIQIRYDDGPVLLFINGKNYGMMNIGEKRDNTGISANIPGVKSEDIDLLVVRNDMGIRVERHKIGKGAVFIRHDAQVVYKGYFEDGAVEYEEISESARQSGNMTAIDDFIALDPTDNAQLDPKSFIASMAAHIIAGNTDFGMNNISFWRSSPVGKDPSPFYVMSFDFDGMFGLYIDQHDMDTLLIYTEDTRIFPQFLEKEQYKDAFIRKIDEFLNGPFNPENVLPIVDKLEKRMEPWIEYHLDMWGEGLLDKPGWKKNVAHLKRFVSARPRFVRMHVRDYFGFSGYSEMTFSVSPDDAGTIYMDTGVFKTPVKGKGKYANIPLNIQAEPSRGYEFSHFSVNSSRVDTMSHSLMPEDGMEITAVYVASPRAPVADIVINEVVRSGAHKMRDEDGERQDWIELYNTTGRVIDLEGMYLSDDHKRPSRWQFPDVSIGPGEFMVIFASGKDRKKRANELHTDFKLSKEPVLLVDVDGKTVIDRMTLNETESIRKNSAGIRHPDGSSIFMSSAVSTPGLPNVYEE